MKGKTLRRLFAWLLCVTLLTACVPAAFAEDGAPAHEATQSEPEEEETTPEENKTPSDGTACEHVASTVPRTDWVPVGEYMKTPQTHAVAKAAIKVTVCALCGAELKREPAGAESEPTPEAHTFADGVCTVCGYPQPAEDDETGGIGESNRTGKPNGSDEDDDSTEKAPCQHEAAAKARTEWVATGGYRIGADTHAAIKAEYSVTVCKHCGEEMDREPTGEEDVADAEPHDFGEGNVCAVCGCAKLSPPANPQDGQGAEPAADEAVAASVGVGETVTVAEASDCTHEGVGWKRVRRNISGEDNGNGTHTVSYDVYLNFFCPECGFHDEKPTEERVENETEAHDYSSYNGKCSGCGAQCLHTKTGIKYSNGDFTYEQVDALTHIEKHNIYKQERCAVCNTVRSKEIASEGLSELTEHSFHNGKCVCGYASGCAHEAAYDAILTRQYNSYSLKSGATLVGKTAAGHTFKVRMRKYCPTCGIYIGEAVDTTDGKTVTFEHDFDSSGVCVDCGYAAAECAHAHRKTEIIWSDSDSYAGEYIDETFHSVIADKLQRVECLDCGATLEENVLSENVTLVEAHSFGIGGYCESCGYVKPCEHEHTNTIRKLIPVSKITAKNEHIHAGVMQMEETVRCSDCRKLVRVSREEAQEVTAEHNWDYEYSYSNGVPYMECRDCGYRKPAPEDTCAHAHTAKRIIYSGRFSITSKSPEGHTIKYGSVIEETRCGDCGRAINETILQENYEGLVAHDFQNGRCRDCGYVNPCKHDGEKLVHTYYRNVRNAKDNGDGTHTLLADVHTVTYCEECGGEIIGDVIERNRTVTEKHDVENGVCIYCYAKAQQTPQSGSDGSGGSSGGSSGGGRTGSAAAVQPAEPLIPQAPAAATQELIVSVNSIALQLTVAPSATVEIVGAEEIMTDAEYQRFDRLNLSEQIMVVLSVAGVTEDITSALPPSATLLTADAQTLIAEITGRIETSGETPFQFEIGAVTVNGVPCKCVTITFEITMDGVKMLTTRSFYFDPMMGEWVAMDALASV